MYESSASIPRLRVVANDDWRLPSASAADEAWLAGGLAPAQLHELFNAEGEEAAAVAGFAVALTLASGAFPLLWLRTLPDERRGGRLRAGGLGELGIEEAALITGLVADEPMLLRAAVDAARCTGVGTLVVERWGAAPGIDLTTTRRLMLAAEASGVTVLLLRIAAEPRPSAAATRWSVAAAPSAALNANAPGAPAFAVECLRRRGAPAGGRWCVEWNRDAKTFRDAPLSGAHLPLVADRAAPRDASAPLRGAR